MELVAPTDTDVTRTHFRIHSRPALAARLAAVCALLPALPACVRTVQGGAPPDAPRITLVRVVGNHRVSDHDIVSGLATRPPEGIVRRVYRRLDRLAMEQDISRVESFYQHQGYFSAKVTNVKVVPVSKDTVHVVFYVDEGQPTRITELDLAGMPQSVRSDHRIAEQTAPLGRGKVIRYDLYEELKTWLQQFLAVHGYPHAEITGKVEIDRDKHTAQVHVTIDPGPLAHFGKTEILGLDHVPDSAVRNRLGWKPGERFDISRLQLTQGRLYQLGLFSAVRMDYAKKGRPATTDVRIALAESKRQDLRLGGGSAVEGGFDPSQLRVDVHLRADYVLRRALHPLAVLKLSARPAWQWILAEDRNGPAGEARATLERYDLFAPLLTGKVLAAFLQEQLESYSDNGPAAGLQAERPFFSDHLTVAAAWRFRAVSFHDVSPAITPEDAQIIGLVEPYRVSALEQSLTFDFRDDPLTPHRGAFARLQLGEGLRALGGTSHYASLQTDLRGYLPVGRHLVLAARTAYDRALAGSLPVTERFYGGGAGGHRGFAFRQLSPTVTDAEGDHALLGGEARFLAQAEARISLGKVKNYPFGVVVFTDAGDVPLTPGGLDLGNLIWAPGVGLRYSPIVAIRVDLAYRLNRYGPRDPAPGDRFAFHLSLGESF